jgi:GxxExxY protein
MSIEEDDEEAAMFRLADQVVAAVVAVYEGTGPGLFESAYQQALSIELDRRGLPHVRQPEVPLVYDGRPLMTMRPDFLICERIVLEVRATDTLVPEDFMEVRTHMRAANAVVGLLAHFNVVEMTPSDVLFVDPWRRFDPL